ncbi:MAG: FAD:protein FMN transferase, partial [Bacteroidia bacterium]|nr:FAD:protein FMN transferase [Bacteroidia bacterium]
MDNRIKNVLYTVVLMAIVYAVYRYRNAGPPEPAAVRIEGQTMGTTYHITYFDAHARDFKPSVDSLLRMVNKSINTYDPGSEVSMFNKSRRGVAIQLPYLLPSLQVARVVFVASSGAFDPTVMPLVNAWGFGPAKPVDPDSAQVDSLKEFVGFNKVTLTEDSVVKADPRVQLDFGGIGQGYGADVIADFLKSKGVTDMLVELGGEGMAVGMNRDTGKPWEIGILDPNSTREDQFYKAYIGLSDRSFTTSGNYFNFRVVNGRKFSHTIDPVTGFPARRAILSASVFADNATLADCWGTAIMSMGHERAIEVLKTHPEVDVLLMYSTPEGIETYVTPGIKSLVQIIANT